MQAIPWWSVPLLSGVGCGLVGLEIASKPNFPITIPQAGLAGTILGIIVGSGVWFANRHDTKGVVLESETPVANWMRETPYLAASLFGGGIAALALNHLWVIYFGKKFIALVLGGSFFTAIGLLGFFVPIVKTERKLNWWEHFISGVFALSGLALAAYLWIVVYP